MAKPSAQARGAGAVEADVPASGLLGICSTTRVPGFSIKTRPYRPCEVEPSGGWCISQLPVRVTSFNHERAKSDPRIRGFAAPDAGMCTGGCPDVGSMQGPHTLES